MAVFKFEGAKIALHFPPRVTVLDLLPVKQRLLSLVVVHDVKLLLQAKMRSLESFGVAKPAWGFPGDAFK